MIIKNIISTKSHEILTVQAKNTLREAATILVQKKIGALPVVDNVGGLIGIISERDIVRICASDNKEAMESLVEGAMTTKLEVAGPDDSVDMALARMTDRRIRHLPVVAGGKLVGIVSIGDLVKIQIDRALAEADAMRAYIQSWFQGIMFVAILRSFVQRSKRKKANAPNCSEVHGLSPRKNPYIACAMKKRLGPMRSQLQSDCLHRLHKKS